MPAPILQAFAPIPPMDKLSDPISRWHGPRLVWAAIAAFLVTPMEPPLGDPLALRLPPIHGAIIRAPT